MKKISRKALSILMALALAFSLLAFAPLTASAADAAALASTINDFNFYTSGSLTAEVSGNTVTVTGTATNEGKILDLNFDPGVTVIWKADYTSSEINSISIGGEGVFELPAGGSFTHMGSGNAIEVRNSAVMTVSISGGEIRSENSGIGGGTKGAIINVSGGLVESRSTTIGAQQAQIHVSGGLVTSSEGSTISNNGERATVTVSGGTVRGVKGVTIGSGLGGKVTISGGLVENLGAYQTISADNFVITGGEVRNPATEWRPGQPGGASPLLVSHDCEISGGVVSAGIGLAVYTNGVNYDIKVNGGFVFAYGTTILHEGLTPYENSVLAAGSVYPTTVGGEAVVCAWNQAAGRTAYKAGTHDDLVVEPSGASAVWGIEGGESGIKYANGSNIGFFMVDGVTVTEEDVIATPPATDGPSLPNNMSEWAESEVEKAYELGLIPDSLLDPSVDYRGPITRAEFAALSVKVYESLSGTKATPAANNPFTDTSDAEVLKAYEVGITTGMSETTFAPDNKLNREQAATMLTRVYKKVSLAGWTIQTDSQFTLTYDMPSPFADDAQISGWAKDSVYFMNANGIIQGVGSNLFAPRAVTSDEEAIGYATATREQAIAIAVRMAENLG